jgi:PIN domain nuclease of toxin-antitoxin system
VPYNIVEEIERHNFFPLDISIEDTLCVGELPLYHNDPFDRFLIAQAKTQGLIIVTRDAHIASYDISTILA